MGGTKHGMNEHRSEWAEGISTPPRESANVTIWVKSINKPVML